MDNPCNALFSSTLIARNLGSWGPATVRATGYPIHENNDRRSVTAWLITYSVCKLYPQQPLPHPEHQRAKERSATCQSALRYPVIQHFRTEQIFHARHNGKGRGHPVTCHEGIGGQKEVQFYVFFNLGASWGGWLKPRPGRNTAEKEPVPTGTYELRSVVKKSYQLRPKVSTARLQKCTSCVPRALIHVCHTQTWPNPSEQTGQRTRSAARDTTHTYTPHTYTLIHIHTTHTYTHTPHTYTHIHIHTTHTHTTHTHHTHKYTPHYTTHTHTYTHHIHW